MGSLAELDEEKVLDLVARGQPIYPVAVQYGVTHQALYKRIAKHPEYRATKEAGMEALLCQRERELEIVKDDATTVAYARARDLLGQARWRAEREVPERWGQKGAAAPSLTVVVHRGDVQIGVSSDAQNERDISVVAPQLTHCTTLHDDNKS